MLIFESNYSLAYMRVCVCTYLADLCIFILNFERERCESSGRRTYMPSSEAAIFFIRIKISIVEYYVSLSVRGFSKNNLSVFFILRI